MCTNIGAVSVLALLVAVLGAERAGAHGGAHARPCTGDQPPLKMTINLQKDDVGNYVATYGQKFVIHCSSENTRHIGMKVNGQSIQAVTINMTTIQLMVDKPDLGYYMYNCIDSGSSCGAYLYVSVEVAMTVNATRVQYELVDGEQYYFVPPGEEYQVLCSGHDGASLRITDDDSKQVQTVGNSTTSVYTTRASNQEHVELIYGCSEKEKTYNGIDYMRSRLIFVTVSYYPQCENFRCIIHDWDKLECTWQYPTDRFTFSLFYTDHDNNKGAILLCDDVPGEINNICKKNIKNTIHETFTMNQNISLLLMTCDKICFNDTFNLNTNSLIKLETVTNLVSKKSSQEAVIKWWSPDVRISSDGGSDWPYRDCDTCVYRVEFRLSAFRDEWRQADTTSVLCGDEGWCEFTLPFLYPDTEYEVRVYRRHKDATDDRVWSDPASVLVRTEPRAACACDAALHTPAGPTASTEAAKCEACAFTESAIKRIIALENKIKSVLQKKLTKIDKISKLLSNIYEVEKELITNEKR